MPRANFFPAHSKAALAILLPAMLIASARPITSQEPEATASAIEQSSRQAVPNLVRFEAALPAHAAQQVILRLSVYATQSGQSPLWQENQLVQTGQKGQFSVLLGAGSAIGLPQSLFATGEPRWLGVQLGDHEELRSLLTSVPYALKAADSDSLGGVPATNFVTQAQLAAKLTATAAALTQRALQPMVAPTGTGTVGYLPIWTSSTALGNSGLFQTGTGAASKVGIGTTTPASSLDVNGVTTLRARVALSSTAATATAGVSSPFLEWIASSYSSALAAPVAQNFVWQVQPLGNNTATPSSQLSLLYSSGTHFPAATGLSIAPSGVITFAPGQSFPASSTAGSFPKGATFGAESFMTGSSTDWMLVATNTSATSKGTILGQANANGIGVEGASPGGIGVEGATDTGYGVYGIANTTGTAVYGGAFGTGPAGSFWSQNAAGPAVVVSNVAGGAGISSTVTNAYSGYFTNNSTTQATVYAAATGLGNAGYFGNNSASHVALAGVNASTDPNAISTYGSTGAGKAIYGVATTGTGVYGAATTGYGGYFANSSTYQATVYSTNAADGNAGYFGNNSISHVALAGINASTDPSAIGVYGNVSKGSAVYGIAPSGNGVFGTTTAGRGVYGTADNGSGVVGQSNSGPAVVGSSISSTGVYGGTTSASGVIGQVGTLSNSRSSFISTGNTAGVWGDSGQNPVATVAAVLGTADSGTAGFFWNNGPQTLVVFNAGTGGTGLFKTFMAGSTEGECGIGGGDLSCTGQMKSLVAAGPDRKVETYAMQSPENWMEDFGSAELHAGVAIVQIDPAFAETVSSSADYHVFLTPNGDSKGLYITRKTATVFEVHESGGGSSSLTFDYRIVARRRGFEGQRLVDVTEKVRAETAESRSKLNATLQAR